MNVQTQSILQEGFSHRRELSEYCGQLWDGDSPAEGYEDADVTGELFGREEHSDKVSFQRSARA